MDTLTPTPTKTRRPRTARRPAAPPQRGIVVAVDANLRDAEQGIRAFMAALAGEQGALYIGRAEYAGEPAVVIALAGPTGPGDSLPVAIVVDPEKVRILSPEDPGAPAKAATPAPTLHTGLYL